MENYVNRRIRNYSVVLLIVACVMFILLGFFSYQEGKEVQLQNFSEIGHHYTEFAEGSLMNILSSDKTYVNVIASNEFVIEYVYKPYDLLMKYRSEVFVKNILTNISEYKSVRIIPTKLPSLSLDVSADDIEIQPIYNLENDFFKNHTCFISPIQKFQGRLGFMIINPIYKDEKVIGQVQMLVDLSNFIETFKKQTTFKETGFMFIFNENRDIILYPNDKNNFVSVDNTMALIFNDLVLDESVSYIIKKTREYFLVKEVNFSNAPYNSKIYFAFTQSGQELFAFNRQLMSNTMGVIIGFVILFSVLTWLYTKRSIRLIHKDTKKVVEKSLDSEVRKQTEELRLMAETDSLTGLYNHGAMYKIIEELIADNPENQPLSLMMLDVDYFKEVNDVYGHQVGDEVLVKIAELLKENIRDIDFAGRYGGEEFILLLRSIHLDKSYTIAERIRKAILATEFTSERIRLSISIGVTQWKGEDVASFIKNADKKLYASKNYGRNKTTF